MNPNLSPKQWSFDVTVSDHDSLKEGVTEKKLKGSQHSHHRLVLSKEEFPDLHDAHLTAAQWQVASGHYVTGVHYRE